MVKCQVCGKELDLPYVCKYCGKTFCVEHRLPEKHNCVGLTELRKPFIIKPKPETVFIPQTLKKPKTRIYIKRKPRLRVSGLEIRHLLLAWIVLGFCFSIRWLFGYPKLFPLMFMVYLLAVGSGFVFHELAHKFTALRFGCWAEFRMWSWGLIMALLFALMSGGSIVFAAPGAVYIMPRHVLSWEIGRRENGIIALMGPLANLILVFPFYLIWQNYLGIIGLIGKTGFYVNLWLAAFNLIPFMGLDGSKVFSWSLAVWGLVTIPTWIYTIYVFFV